tara:strand:+ start:126 stop:410 length:285 start_codon:yes stop_codon:yes gene_type:complete
MSRIKLTNFKASQVLETFINHLEAVPTTEKIVFVLLDDNTLLLESSIVDNDSVFYSSWFDAANNKLLITLGVDCDATNVLSEYDHEQLDMKGFI